jgi:hypothetical protein
MIFGLATTHGVLPTDIASMRTWFGTKPAAPMALTMSLLFVRPIVHVGRRVKFGWRIIRENFQIRPGYLSGQHFTVHRVKSTGVYHTTEFTIMAAIKEATGEALMCSLAISMWNGYRVHKSILGIE